MRLPDYYGGSIVNLMASIQQGLGGQPHPYVQHRLLPSAEITPYRQVLLWVIDGLGLNYLQAHAEAVNLNANLLGGMTSVYPPTTASAITTFLTGEAPQQHGLTGWHVYFRELGAVLAILPGKPRYGGVSLGQA
ncbi:MAG: alkaline phosphatase family protein, partial [Candidatus Thiodiazotropha sp. 6PLUC4]